MSANDVWTYEIQCPGCGHRGKITWSEFARPSIYSGTGRTLKALSEGFRGSREKDPEGDPRVICLHCLSEFDT